VERPQDRNYERERRRLGQAQREPASVKRADAVDSRERRRDDAPEEAGAAERPHEADAAAEGRDGELGGAVGYEEQGRADALSRVERGWEAEERG